MRARLVAPLVAAVLGIAGGVTTALVTDHDPAPAASDPLGLGIPLVNQSCSLKSITVLAYGDSTAVLENAIANAGDTKVSYLRGAESCDTVYGSPGEPVPRYVVYSGPYAATKTPCASRMEGDDRRGSVTRLRSGNTDFVKCSCVLPDDVAPTLRVGDPVDGQTVAWIRLLQVMLHDNAPKAFPDSDVTGRYEQPTADRVAYYQARSPGKATVPGVVDATTWGILNQRLCPHYSW